MVHFNFRVFDSSVCIFLLLQLIKVSFESQDSLISLLLTGADLREALKLIMAGLTRYR